MPYKDKEKQRQAQRRYRERNRVKCNDRCDNNKRELRRWFKEYKKTLCCSECPENHPACLDFHHREKDDKLFTVSYMVGRGYSKARVLAEIKKCIVLCANCHRKLHDT